MWIHSEPNGLPSTGLTRRKQQRQRRLELGNEADLHCHIICQRFTFFLTNAACAEAKPV